MNFSDELDRSFGSGPPAPPTGDLVAAGHRAVRRRRGLQAAGGVLAALVAVAALGLGGSGPTRAIDQAPATSGPTSSPAPDDGAPADGGVPVRYDRSGDLRVAPGAEVLQRIADPLERTAPAASVALWVRYRGAESYWLLDRDDTGSMGSSDPTDKAAGSLEEWVQYQKEAMGIVEPVPPVTLEDDGTLTPAAGVEIVEQRSGVDVGGSFAGPGAPTAAAMVLDDGVRGFVLVRRLPGSPPEYLPTSARVGGPDLESFLEHARRQYASGEGLR